MAKRKDQQEPEEPHRTVTITYLRPEEVTFAQKAARRALLKRWREMADATIAAIAAKAAEEKAA